MPVTPPTTPPIVPPTIAPTGPAARSPSRAPRSTPPGTPWADAESGVIMAAARNAAPITLRIILNLLFELGSITTAPRLVGSLSRIGTNASLPRRNMRNEKAEQNSRRTRSLYQGRNGRYLRLADRYDDFRSA